jgi:hypothetical protein
MDAFRGLAGAGANRSIAYDEWLATAVLGQQLLQSKVPVRAWSRRHREESKWKR